MVRFLKPRHHDGVGAAEILRVDVLEHRLVHQDNSRRHLCHNGSEELTPVLGVDRDLDRADKGAGKPGADPISLVGKHAEHEIAGPHSLPGQDMCPSDYRVEQLPIGLGFSSFDVLNRAFVWRFRRSAHEQVRGHVFRTNSEPGV